MLGLRTLLPILYTFACMVGWATIPATVLILVDLRKRRVPVRRRSLAVARSRGSSIHRPA